MVSSFNQPYSITDLRAPTAALQRTAYEGPGAHIPLPSLTLQVLTLHDACYKDVPYLTSTSERPRPRGRWRYLVRYSFEGTDLYTARR